MVRAGALVASQCIVLADCSMMMELEAGGRSGPKAEGQGEENGEKKKGVTAGAKATIEALTDADAIFAYQMVRSLKSDIVCCIEIINPANVSFLDPQEGLLVGDIDYKFTPQFASGNVLTSSLLDTLICQAFYNRHIVSIIELFAAGVTVKDRSTIRAEVLAAGGGGAFEPEAKRGLAAIKGSSLYQVKVPESMLPNRYQRGELPCTIEHGLSGHYLSWAAPLDNLDYEYYLPIFFDGLQCKENPARFIARQGIDDLLYAAKGYPDRIIPCIKNLVRPIRNALSKFDVDILLGVLKAIQLLVMCTDGVGPALLPYSKQFLAPIASFMDMNKNLGDGIDYGQRKDDDVGENVRKVLEMLEERGGPGAFEAIKFCVPMYQRVLRNTPAQHHKNPGLGGGH
jgi:hypothetical protein